MEETKERFQKETIMKDREAKEEGLKRGLRAWTG